MLYFCVYISIVIPLGEIMSFPDIRGFDVSIDDVKNELLQRGNVHVC